MHNTGVIGRLRSRLDKNRVGDLLLSRGRISRAQLQAALDAQKNSHKPLGEVLRDQGLISAFQLRVTLAEQFAYRALTLSATVYFSAVTFTGMRSSMSAASAKGGMEYGNNIEPAAEGVQLASLEPMPRGIDLPAPRIQNLFGSREVRSSNMAAFTKWNGVVAKLDNAGMTNWGNRLNQYKSLPMRAQVEAVNAYVNNVPYIEDKDNWGKSDYWATPAEFFARGGDCEDYAIAKYAALRTLGVPETSMRLAVVQDKLKNVPHAVLIVYTDEGPMVLDNQNKTVVSAATQTRYQPIYSINRQAWWRHV